MTKYSSIVNYMQSVKKCRAGCFSAFPACRISSSAKRAAALFINATAPSAKSFMKDYFTRSIRYGLPASTSLDVA